MKQVVRTAVDGGARTDPRGRGGKRGRVYAFVELELASCDARRPLRHSAGCTPPEMTAPANGAEHPQAPKVFAEDVSDAVLAEGQKIAKQVFFPDAGMSVVTGFSAIAAEIRRIANEQCLAEHSSWNVIVGQDFGAYVTHRTKTYMFFQIYPVRCSSAAARRRVCCVAGRDCLAPNRWRLALRAPG